MKLSQLNRGITATVTAVAASGDIMQKLSRLGVVEGARILVIRKGLKGDPIEISVYSSRLALRREVADAIEVSV